MKENDKVAGKVKILLLGDSAVGKSSLLTQYCDKDFSLGHMPTIGIEYKQKVLNLNNNKSVKIQLWDTAGHERFRTITPVYYRNVDGVLLIFDITQQSTF
jgi:small GTP-binding protein